MNDRYLRCKVTTLSIALALAIVGATQETRSEETNRTLDVDATRPDRLILHVCDADGTPLRPLIRDVGLRNRFDRQGTPDVSADGKKVTFDAWASSPEFTWEESRIIVTDFNGPNAADVSDGVMPSFSPDGLELVVSRPPKYAKVDGAKGKSIWTMNADGTNKKMIADQGAWGARWSPDGTSLIFHGGVNENGENVGANCLRLYDFKSKIVKTLFTSDESPFADLSYHFDWTKGKPRLVAFAGPLKDGEKQASAIMDADIGLQSLKILDEAAEGVNVLHGMSFDWHPDGDAILVTGIVDNRPFPVNLSITGNPNVANFSGVPIDVGVRDPAYTPDGKHLIASFFAMPN